MSRDERNPELIMMALVHRDPEEKDEEIEPQV